MKTIKFISVFIIIILSFICHFLYQLIPNDILVIFMPINESIWEHMKLIITPSLIFSIFEILLYREKKIEYHNFIFSYAIAIPIGIISYLFIYIPLDTLLGHNIIVAIILLFLIYILIQIISYKIINYREIKYSNIYGLILIIIMYFLFAYLTYHPPKINLFYDMVNKGYSFIK